MSDMYLGSQLPMYQNVRIRVFNKDTGEVRLERTCKNRVTRLMLWGIARFLSGEFNNSTPDKIYEYIPRYLALGKNVPSAEGGATSVATTVSVNDTRLLNEYTVSNSTGRSEPVKRIDIQGRHHAKTHTAFSDSFVKLSFSTYISSSVYNNLTIGEAGLFSKEKDNNCLARVVFTPFEKRESDVIDVQWDITLLSYGATVYPQSVAIDGPNKVLIPLSYTPYKIVNRDTGLYFDPEGSVIYTVDTKTNMTVNVYAVDLNNKTIDSLIDDYKTLLHTWTDDNNEVHYTHSISSSAWITEISTERNCPVETLVKELHELMCCGYINDNQIYCNTAHINSAIHNKPTVFYLGEAERTGAERPTLIADVDNNLLLDSLNSNIAGSDPSSSTSYAQSIMASEIYIEELKYKYTYKGFKISSEEGSNNKFIVDRNGAETKYVIKDNEIFYKDSSVSSGYVSTQVYLTLDSVADDTGHIYYYIIDYERRKTGYVYDDLGEIFTEELIEPVPKHTLNSFLKCSSSDYSKFEIWEKDIRNQITDTGYFIDWSSDKEVYKYFDDTKTGYSDSLYHVTNDNYFAIGETLKLIPIITPTNATDRTVSWSVVNTNISKINKDGVLHGWNLGETYAYVSTINNVRSRVNVEVVRDTTLVHVDSLTIDPDAVVFDLKSGEGVYMNLCAVIEPAYASYNVVNWTLDELSSNMIVIEPTGNTTARVRLNGSKTIGRGFITASTADGKTATCLVQVSENPDGNLDCDTEEHEHDKTKQ